MRAATDSGEPSRERIKTSTSPTVCGVNTFGGLHLGAHRGDGAARDAGAVVTRATPDVELVAGGVSQDHTEQRFVALEGFDLVRDQVAIVAKHAIRDPAGHVAGQFAGAQAELAQHPVAGIGGGGVEQGGMLGAAFVDHEGAHGQGHRDGGCHGDGYVLALEAGDGHGAPVLLV